MNKINILITTTLLAMFLSGCSVYMAAHQPSFKNIDLFREGTPRSMLIAEFGMPISSEMKGGKKYEIFKFKQGYGSGAKAGRAVGHGVADAFTLGLWEIVGTPTESVFNGTEMAYQVRYDDKELVDQVISLKKE